MSTALVKIRAIYNAKFIDMERFSDERFLREPIGSSKFGEPTDARDAIDAVAKALELEPFTIPELADLVTIQSLVDLVDDRTA